MVKFCQIWSHLFDKAVDFLGVNQQKTEQGSNRVIDRYAEEDDSRAEQQKQFSDYFIVIIGSLVAGRFRASTCQPV